MRPIRHQSDLDDLRRAAQAYGVIAAWAGAGLFRALADGGPLAAEELPGAPRALSISATMLTHPARGVDESVDVLANLTALTSLELRSCTALTDISALKGHPGLDFDTLSEMVNR